MFVCSGLQENIFHGQAPGLWPLKMDKPWLFFRQDPNKIPFYKISYQGFTSKQIWLVSYHLKTIFCNPRRNVELIMGRSKYKQSTSFYALRCIN